MHIGPLSIFRTLVLRKSFYVSGSLGCRFNNLSVVVFLILKRRQVIAVAVYSSGVVECIYILKYKIIRMVVISDSESVQPLPFY